MQSLTASNSVLTFSPKLRNQLLKSTIDQLPMINQNKTVKDRGNVKASFMSIMPRTSLVYVDEETRMNKFIEVKLQVQEDEVNENGIVNECIYSKYCQQGHLQLLTNVGLALGGAFTSTTLSNFTSNEILLIHLHFYSIQWLESTPLQRGDDFAVKVKVSCTSTTSIYVETYIYRLPDSKIILESEAEIVLLGKNYKPAHISQGVRAKLLFLDSADLFV